jgi:hypothetical protein
VFSPELVLVSPELREEAFALLEEPWLVRKDPALAPGPAAEPRLLRSSLPRWQLVGVLLLIANVLGASWNLGLLSFPDGLRTTLRPASAHDTTAAGRQQPVVSSVQSNEPRTSSSLGAVVQMRKAGATAATSQSVPTNRRRVVNRESIAGGGYSWRGGHFLVTPDGLTVTRFSAQLCPRLGPLPPMRIDALGRFGLRRTLRDVDIRLAGTFVTDEVAHGTITTRGTGCAKRAVFKARIS